MLMTDDQSISSNGHVSLSIQPKLLKNLQSCLSPSTPMKNATMSEVSFYYLFHLLFINMLPDNIKHSIPAVVN